MWNMEQDSEHELNLQNKKLTRTLTDSTFSTESEKSENASLLSPKRTPEKITTSKLEIAFGDNTSTVIYSKRQLARKTIARKALEPRGTLKP